MHIKPREPNKIPASTLFEIKNTQLNAKPVLRSGPFLPFQLEGPCSVGAHVSRALDLCRSSNRHCSHKPSVSHTSNSKLTTRVNKYNVISEVQLLKYFIKIKMQEFSLQLRSKKVRRNDQEKLSRRVFKLDLHILLLSNYRNHRKECKQIYR